MNIKKIFTELHHISLFQEDKPFIRLESFDPFNSFDFFDPKHNYFELRSNKNIQQSQKNNFQIETIVVYLYF